MSEERVARQYERWLTGHSLSGALYSFYSTVPGQILVNTPVFRLDKELLLKPEHRLLDVGCGKGSMLRVLESHVALDQPSIGIDVSAAMMRGARKAQSAGRPALLRGAASDLPLPNSSIDIALSAYMIKHLTDYEVHRFFQELWRVLVPGGYAVIWEFSPASSAKLNGLNRWFLTRGVKDCNLRDLEQIVHLAAAAGFEWANAAHLRPFIWPPIPRTSVIVGKAPEGWEPTPEGVPQPL